MPGGERRYTDEVPADVEAQVREVCLALPEVAEERAWKGTRWVVRRKTFAHVLGVDDGSGSAAVLAFRSAGEELAALRHAGRPYVVLGWGRDAMGLVLDDRTDWDEVGELVTESYCLMAPKRLAAQVDRPAQPPPADA